MGIVDLRNAVRQLPLKDGVNQTVIPYFTIYRYTEDRIQMPQIEAPYLYIVLDGAVRLYTPSGIMDYIAGQYSISKIDTPLSGTVTAFSERSDYIAAAIEFTVNDVITVVLDMDNDLIVKISSEGLDEDTAILSDEMVIESVGKMFTVMNQAVSSDFMRKNILREIIYYLLCGSCGKQFIQSIANISNTNEIYKANSWIKENFKDSFTIEKLAEQRNMSVSLFHQRFKSAVGMGPLQCQKRLRLTEARRIMVDENKNVTEAAMEVGYESLSQFIRDYRRMFGSAPKEDISKLMVSLKK